MVWLEVPKTDLPDGNNDVDTMYKGKNLGFAVDKVEAVLNKEFAQENPAATKFLSLMQITAPANIAGSFPAVFQPWSAPLALTARTMATSKSRRPPSR